MRSTQRWTNESRPTPALRAESITSLATPALGTGDDRAELGSLDERIDIDAFDDRVDVDPFHDPIEVEAGDDGVHVQLRQQHVEQHDDDVRGRGAA